MPDSAIDYATNSQRPSKAWLVFGITSCCTAIAAIIVPFPSILEVASYPPGTSMRPMGATAMLFLGAAAGLVIAMPLALLCLISGWRRRGGMTLGAIALLLGLVAIFGDGVVFKYIIASRGYVMEP